MSVAHRHITAMFIQTKQRLLPARGLRRDMLGVFFFKGCSMVLNYAIVALILKVINTTDYGVWLTITSIVSWATFMDFGLSNGLKNKFVGLFLHKKHRLIRIYISSSLVMMSAVGAALVLAVAAIASQVDLPDVLNTLHSQQTLFLILFFSVLFFVAKAITDLVQTFKVAEQNVSYVTYITFVSNLALFVWVLTMVVLQQKARLFSFSFVYALVPFLVSLVYAAHLLQKPYRQLRPRLACVSFRLTKDVYRLSLSFFLVQLAGIIIFSTDNFIVSSLFNPQEVAKYNIAYRLFGIVPTIINVIMTPFWPALARSFAVGDLENIRTKMKRLLGVWCLFALLGCGLFAFASPLYRLWLDKDLGIGFHLNLGMLVYALITSWNMIFATFINSIGKIRLQLFSSIAAGILNIPLSVYFGKEWGPHGIIWATVVCLLPSAVWSPIQCFKLTSGKARGIWNK